MVKRAAFSLIELIFAIVVLSVAFLALPQLFWSTSAQIEEIAKDEATFYGIKTLQNVYRYYWDDKSEKDGAYYILDTTNGDSELNRFAPIDPNHRKGTFSFGSKAGQRRFYAAVTYASNTLGTESGEPPYNDIDDFNGMSFTNPSALVDTVSNIKVYYISDRADYARNSLSVTLSPAPVAASTNIKMIEVNMTDISNNPLLLYRMFVCNVGARPIERRELR
jgi:type II secretory pathway pseudopilin PulG